MLLFVSSYAQTDSTGVADTLSAAHTRFAPAATRPLTKSEGDSAYLKSDYASAIEIYESLLKEGEHPELYYNLGNSYYKTDNLARAILNYERALLLSPGNSDVRANLEIARAKTIDKVIPVPRIFFVEWGAALVRLMDVETWGIVGLTAFILLLASACLYVFTGRVKWKKCGFAGILLFLVVSVLANYFAYSQRSKLLHPSEAIVLTPSVTVRSTPSESGTTLFILHEGRKVEVQDNSMREWKEIRLEDGKVGWVPAESIEVI
ncbi:MAG: tetratricopeptide repeat protein [Prevotellaceae bacterium]|nr:tetratricopeptide repeat protein [Prevotellaceae bacterium]